MEKLSKELNSSRKQDFQESHNVTSHKEAVEQIAKEFDAEPKEVEHLMRYFLVRVLSKAMIAKKSISIQGFGKLIYGGRGPKKQKQLHELKDKPRKVIIRL